MHDPFDYGYRFGWNNSRKGRSLMPSSPGRTWRELTKLYNLCRDVVHGNKTPDSREIVPKPQRALEVL